MAKFEVKNDEITITKELNDIDNFVIRTTDIIKKYAEYVIVSGYVAIFFGRSRISEDVDLFIKELPLKKFKEMYSDFIKKEDSGLDKDSTIMLNQIRTIDNSRLMKRISSLDNFILEKIDRAIKISLAL